MEDKTNILDSLLERAYEYGDTSIELIKLKTLDKTTDVVSYLIPRSIVFGLIVSFMIFLNLGLAFWLGEILGKIFYGFFAVAGFYFIAGMVVYFLLHKWIRRLAGDYFVKQMLK